MGNGDGGKANTKSSCDYDILCYAAQTSAATISHHPISALLLIPLRMKLPFVQPHLAYMAQGSNNNT